MDNKDSLLNSLNRRQGAIKKISKVASFQTLKTLADGIFMSKLIYLMPVWGGCEAYLLKSLQVVQNKVARSVTKYDKFTTTKKLMDTCNWMTVRQLVSYHSLVQLQKTINSRKPAYLYQKVTSGGSYPYPTRQAASGQLRQVDGARADLDIAKQGWGCRAVEEYNKLPPDIRQEVRLPSFKRKLRSWVVRNVSL